jgi:hypothetical protein
MGGSEIIITKPPALYIRDIRYEREGEEIPISPIEKRRIFCEKMRGYRRRRPRGLAGYG